MANFGEWPHICAVLSAEYIGEDVSIQIKPIVAKPDTVQEQLVKVYQCGASLIDYGVVLTAGHCVNNTE